MFFLGSPIKGNPVLGWPEMTPIRFRVGAQKEHFPSFLD
jgi:hypothetical protein